MSTQGEPHSRCCMLTGQVRAAQKEAGLGQRKGPVLPSWSAPAAFHRLPHATKSTEARAGPQGVPDAPHHGSSSLQSQSPTPAQPLLLLQPPEAPSPPGVLGWPLPTMPGVCPLPSMPVPQASPPPMAPKALPLPLLSSAILGKGPGSTHGRAQGASSSAAGPPRGRTGVSILQRWRTGRWGSGTGPGRRQPGMGHCPPVRGTPQRPAPAGCGGKCLPGEHSGPGWAPLPSIGAATVLEQDPWQARLGSPLLIGVSCTQPHPFHPLWPCSCQCRALLGPWGVTHDSESPTWDVPAHGVSAQERCRPRPQEAEPRRAGADPAPEAEPRRGGTGPTP